MTLGILNIGPIELLIVVGAAVLLFGGDLPDVARKAARFVARLRALGSELTRELDAPRDLPRPPRLDLPDTGLGEELRRAARLESPPPAPPTPPPPPDPTSSPPAEPPAGDRPPASA